VLLRVVNIGGAVGGVEMPDCAGVGMPDCCIRSSFVEHRYA